MTTCIDGPRQASPTTQSGTITLRLLVLLAFIAATSPLATDLYLASFPAIQQSLVTTPMMVQLTLTAYLIGVSIGQPIWGPLSDRYGRRRPLLISNALTVVSSVVVAFAPTIEVLIAARFVQALSAASGMVLARAMVADLAHGYAGVRALSLMMTVHGAVPVIAPAFGGLMATVMPWRGVLVVFAVIVTFQLIAAVILVPETLPRERRAVRLRYSDLGRVLTRPAFSTYALTLALAMSSLMAYIASSSFVYQEVLGLSPLLFGLSFAVNATGMTAAGLISAALARRRVHPARTIACGLSGMLVSALLVVAAAASPWPILLVGAIFINAASASFVMSNCMGLAMEQAHGIPGAGSAMLGMLMFGISAMVSPLAGLVDGPGTAVAMGAVMATMALLATVAFVLGRAWVTRNPESEAAFASTTTSTRTSGDDAPSALLATDSFTPQEQT